MEEARSKFAIHEACREGQSTHTPTSHIPSHPIPSHHPLTTPSPATRVESLLNANPKLPHLRDEDDRLPLHWAVSYNRLPIVQTLVQTKNFDADAPDGSGWTPLMMACSRQNDDADTAAIISVLLAKDADPNATNNAGQTALHFCASKAHLDITRTLLAHGASARVKDRRGQLPLHRAAAVGCVPVLRELLGKGKSPVNAADVDGMTALHHAVCEGHGDAAVLLLVVGGAEWDRKDGEGRVPLELCPDVKTRRFIVQAAEREGIDLE